MTSRKLNLQVRRQWRKSKKQVENLGSQASEQLERNLVKRLNRLTSVRRFIVSWLALLLLLIGCLIAQTQALSGFYQTNQPKPGGVYNEGILGDYTNANPVYATDPVDSAVSRLVFSGLLTYNNQNELVNDLASSWSVNNLGTIYTIHLKPNLKWQDGKPLTSADVLFTYQVIQSPDAQSPLLSSWQGVNIAAPNPRTITFTLPNPLTSFPYSLTTGIIPKHLLGGVPMAEMRSVIFNTLSPVGSGPFIFKGVESHGNTPQTKEADIELTPFPSYIGGQPKLTEFVIKAFHDQGALVNAFNHGELTAISGLSSVPPGLKQANNTEIDNFPLTAAVMVFFKTSAGTLSDVNVRKALILSADQLSIITGLGYPTVAVNEPLLQGQLAYNQSYRQAGYDPSAAAQVLASDGWLLGNNGIRYKDGQPLAFTLTASNSSEYSYVANTLQKDWRAVGVNLQLSLQDSSDLQNSLTNHSYDALLYGISIGVDPDVFVYWDSSQVDPRSTGLNLSEYKSSIADDSLEEGRTRLDPALRIIKYQPFLQAWQQDAPALGLYQPRYLYITNGPVYGLNEHTINNDTGRYSDVQNWEIQEARVAD